MYTLYDAIGAGGVCVHAALAEIGAPFDRVEMDLGKGDQRSDWFTAINPRRQVPALALPDGSVMTESAAMLLHLANAHPEAGLTAAPGTPERARVTRWMVFMATNLYEGECRRTTPERYIAGDDGIDRIEASATGFLAANYRILEAAASGGPYFDGDSFSILDIYIWTFVNWWGDYGWMRENCPKILGIAKTVMARPKIVPVQKFHFGERQGFNVQTP